MIDYKSMSLANQVFETIERNILNGVYPQGDVLSESRLSEELGVSRTPIREALTRLETEKLISTTPMGAVVLGITDKDVKDNIKAGNAEAPDIRKYLIKSLTCLTYPNLNNSPV